MKSRIPLKEKTMPGATKRGRVYKRKDIAGIKYGRLTAIRYDHTDSNGLSLWECICDCGKMILVRSNALAANRIKSCGCSRPVKDPTREHPLYHLWQCAKDRCYNPKAKSFHRYGGRGIKMYDKWVDDYDSFYEYCKDLYIKGRKIDRIDNDGNYEPGNIRWSTDSVSVRNRSVTKLNEEKVREIRRSTLTHKELANIYGISKQTVAEIRKKNRIQWKEVY